MPELPGDLACVSGPLSSLLIEDFTTSAHLSGERGQQGGRLKSFEAQQHVCFIQWALWPWAAGQVFVM